MILSSSLYKGQVYTVINERLQIQLAKNQAVRSASNETFFKSYEKQKALYDSINKKAIQVVAIQTYIHDSLYKINTSISNGKKLKYIYKDLGYLSNKSVELIKLTAKYPQYALLLYEQYAVIVNRTLSLKEELNEVITQNRRNLKDPYDVSVMLEGVHSNINVLIEYVARLSRQLESASKKTYWKSIPKISYYVNLDKAIIKNIINRSSILFKK